MNFGFQNFPGFNVASPKIPTARGDFALLGDLSARWSGTITAPTTATYTLGLTARGDAKLPRRRCWSSTPATCHPSVNGSG
ncbi:PA14 domain-containing protein [Aeromicrobium sp. UC242_57]|uniref:PA14 domain-containing protein n=1 Tax=Aeromicrobium sp. UC242_57 TaxID=3374624 RepID=UPI00379EB8D2